MYGILAISAKQYIMYTRRSRIGIKTDTSLEFQIQSAFITRRKRRYVYFYHHTHTHIHGENAKRFKTKKKNKINVRYVVIYCILLLHTRVEIGPRGIIKLRYYHAKHITYM